MDVPLVGDFCSSVDVRHVEVFGLERPSREVEEVMSLLNSSLKEVR